jgi:hypothetical protein
MTDQHIRTRLAELPTARVAGKPYGTVAILRSTIDAADDADALKGWIEAHEGRLIEREPMRKRGLAPGAAGPRFSTVADPYYVIRAAALDGSLSAT